MLDNYNLNYKKTTCKIGNCYMLLTILLAAMLILVTTICHCCIKTLVKTKRYITKIYYILRYINKKNIKMGSNNELKEIDIKNQKY